MNDYQELLNAYEWKNFSNEILKRDNYTCQICHKKGFQNRLLIPIASLNEALDFFSDYRFDGNPLQNVINDKRNCKRNEFYFKATKCHNIFRPFVEQKDNETTYQRILETFEYEDTRLFCDHAPPGKVFFYHKPLYCMLMAHDNFDISTLKPLMGKEYDISDNLIYGLMLQSFVKKNDILNNDLYAACFMIDHFCRTSNVEGGYIQVIDNVKSQLVKVITNEFCIFIDLWNDGQKKLFPKLNVHHTFYYYGNTLPWGYYWKDLITLCEDCHHHLHMKDEIPIYDINMRKINDELKTCDRCGGTGFLPQYNHVQNGICFKCHGTRKIFMK